MIVGINYQKRKNLDFYKCLECYNFSETQNYIPIYNRFFSLSDSNYNNINLNHNWYIINIKENVLENKNIYNCTIKNIYTLKIKTKPVFFKLAPLLDPFKYLIGKYIPNDEKLFNLPLLSPETQDFHPKFLDMNNASYVDGFFSFLNSHLIHHHNFIHGVDFFGSFLSIKKDFAINIFDDLDYLNKSDYFNKNKNILFQVDDYNFIFDDDEDKKTKKPLIKIDHSKTTRTNISINDIDDSIFKDVFSTEQITLESLKDKSIDLVDITNSNEFVFKNNLTTTLKSGSTCSSRTSYTENDENHDLDQDNSSCYNKVSIDDSDDNTENQNAEEDDEDNDDDNYEDCSSYTEERINATIPKFPVQIICMEKCENTFDDLILNEELSEMEWYSAFMQIIMILIIYQKVFAFTHNDLHTNNVMYNSTDKKYIYYCYKQKYYKVPTFGRIFKIIDFGRSIYKYNGKLFCSDSFQQGGDASTQYNTEPYFNDSKPRLEPNYSFDLCRLACSIFDYMVEDLEEIKVLEDCDPVTRLIVEWCLDDKGINLLYKNDGTDRYPDFKLYKMIARCVHNHIPQAQLERPEFSSFAVSKNKIPETDKIMNIDDLPCYV